MLPQTCRVVITIKLEFSASVSFIHKKSVTMNGHTILKLPTYLLGSVLKKQIIRLPTLRGNAPTFLPIHIHVIK